MKPETQVWQICCNRRPVINRQEYFAAQREITRKAARAEAEAARRIRAVTRRFTLPLARQFSETGNVIFPKEELSRQIDHIIREESAKPVEAARKLQADMETTLAKKLGIPLPARAEPRQNARRRRENARGSTDVRQGRGWGYGILTSGKTVSAYRRDPQTGKIIWDDTPLEYRFAKRAGLSTLVWKVVEEQEQMVFDVIRGGTALGRNVKDIGKDLETFINYQNGGARVVGRWGRCSRTRRRAAVRRGNGNTLRRMEAFSREARRRGPCCGNRTPRRGFNRKWLGPPSGERRGSLTR